MYDKRIKIFIALIASLMIVCIIRLTSMQLRKNSEYLDKIADLKLQLGSSKNLNTMRGQILDRNGRILANDEADFKLYINYSISSFLDKRIQQMKLLQAAKSESPEKKLAETKQQINDKLNDLKQIIDKCECFGFKRTKIEKDIKIINDTVWDLRISHAWRGNCSKSKLLEKYEGNLLSIKISEITEDFEQQFPDLDKRLILIGKTNITEMHKYQPLLTLKDDDDIFTAQLEFMNIEGLKIQPRSNRIYPYGCLAAHTIGWVGPATQLEDKQLFADDELSNYITGEVCGKEDGVEYNCETFLRGRRGKIDYDMDHQLINRTNSQFGKNITLTLDIELQKKIRDHLISCEYNPNYKSPTAAVVIDVTTGDILAMVSLPSFDLNNVRYDYSELAGNKDKPMINRAINEQYPPGSVVKPLILAAGLESGKITPDTIISCSSHDAPEGWPNCWHYKMYHSGHDEQWPNNAKNAIKGSCNKYFSLLANRIEPDILQQWLLKFGYGRKILEADNVYTTADRNFRQARGIISSTIPQNDSDLPPIKSSELRWFGIGQGNMRVTPLQVANSMAIIARGGLYKEPTIFFKEQDPNYNSTSLDISPETLQTIRKGMYAVVNEYGGTAYKAFVNSEFNEHNITVYGKTGSTENPCHAWFAGFAEDSMDRCVALAIIVEGGKSGTSDAAPLARKIVQLCLEAGYIGKQVAENQ